MRQKIISAGLVIALFVTGFSSTVKDAFAATEKNVVVLKSITEDGEYKGNKITQFTYASNGLITKQVVKDNYHYDNYTFKIGFEYSDTKTQVESASGYFRIASKEKPSYDFEREYSAYKNNHPTKIASQSEVTALSGGGSEDSSVTIVYDSKKRVKKITDTVNGSIEGNTSEGTTKRICSYSYNSKGLLTKCIYTVKSKKASTKDTYTVKYNKKKRITKAAIKYSNGEKTVKSYKNVYNKKGNVIRSAVTINDYNKKGKKIATQKRTYVYTYTTIKVSPSIAGRVSYQQNRAKSLMCIKGNVDCNCHTGLCDYIVL